MIMEGETCPDMPSASWGNKKASDRLQFKSEEPRTRGADNVTSTASTKSQLEGSDVEAQEEMGVPAQGERENSLFLLLFVLPGPSVVGDVHHFGEGGSSPSVY